MGVNAANQTAPCGLRTQHTMTANSIIRLISTEAKQLAERVGVEVPRQLDEFVLDYIEGGKKEGINEQTLEEGGFAIIATNFTQRNGYEIDFHIICTKTKRIGWQVQGTRNIVVFVPKAA